MMTNLPLWRIFLIIHFTTSLLFTMYYPEVGGTTNQRTWKWYWLRSCRRREVYKNRKMTNIPLSYMMTNCLLFTLFTCRSNSLYKRLLDGFFQKVWSIARRYHQSMHLKFIDMKNVDEKIHSQEDDDDKFTFMEDFLDNMNLSRSSYITALVKVLLYISYN